jgi:hypothetical protein
LSNPALLKGATRRLKRIMDSEEVEEEANHWLSYIEVISSL